MELLRTVAEYFLWFLLYSVCGWIMETTLYAVRKKQAVKRGFLFGPLCPIYGVGMILCMLLFYGRIENIFLLFLAGAFVCTVLEYVTHFVLEKLFHSTWWDYSGKKFNIRGRVCLQNTLLFGVGVVLIVRVFQPFLIFWTAKIPNTVLYAVSFVLYTMLIVDLTTTIAGLKNTVEVLKRLQTDINEHLQKNIDETDAYMTELSERIKASALVSEAVERFRHGNSPLVRLHNAYPHFKLERYKDAVQLLFDKIDEKKDEHKKDAQK